MKKTLLFLTALGLMLGMDALTAIAADPAPLPAGSSDLVHREPAPAVPAKADPAADIAKERDELKVTLANAQAQQQQTSVAAEYYKAVAERNQALLQIVQLQADLASTQKSLADAQAKLNDFEKKAADQRALDSARAAVSAKKP